ncbi:MAG TPA: type 4a pilus biogenesis protein PilO [Gemmatimonadales bacterium]|nr:type 4a pilus biogenesis protein PilO [Gemmatimonadales bacterium]
MALLPTDQRSQVMLLVILLAAIGGYGFWHYYYEPTSTQISSEKTEIDSLQIVVDRAKQDLAQGTVEDLRQRVEQYRGMLLLMRRLVPEQNEVPALIDDISTRAKVRGVSIGRIEPLPVEPGAPFDTYRYRLEILGHYDQLGEYLSDIASLPRIVVPQDISLKPASQGAQRLLNDTIGALLEADLAIRTFVKSAPPPGAQKKPGAKAGE